MKFTKKNNISCVYFQAFCKTRDIPTNEGTKKSVDIGRCPDNPKYSQNNQDQRNSAYSTDIDRFKDGQLPENPDYSNNERSVKGLEHGGDRERPSSPWEDELREYLSICSGVKFLIKIF